MIDFQHVSKNFGRQVVLDDVSFRIHSGNRVGAVGPNGAGKSTILSLITHDQSPDAGEVIVPAGLRVGHMRQQLRPHAVTGSVLAYTSDAIPELPRIHREMTGIEERLARGEEATSGLLKRLGDLQTEYEHLGGYTLRTRAEAILCGLGFAASDLDRRFQEFSGGWQMRAELARVLVASPDILLLDEPTNYLDVPATEWMSDFLRDFQGTLVLISHDRFLLNTLTDTTLEVASGHVTRYPGAYDWYVANRGQRREQIEASQRNRQRRREHMERFIERFRSKSTKASQVQSRIKMLEKLNDEGGEHLPPPLPETHISLPAPPHCGIEVLRVDRAGLSYDGNRWIFRHFDLRIERGEKLAVVGLNGMGKTTLLRVLAGDLPLTEGRRTQGHGVALRYHAQETARELHPERTVFETARSAAPDMPERELRTFLGAFRFPGEAVDKRVEVLSGGEKVRLSLSRLLLDPANVLILDEPTTHLDVSSREALEEALRVYTGTVCLVSHDISFIRNVATGIIAITASGLKRYYGDYTYYREKVREEQETAATDPPAVELGSEPGMAGASGDRRARRREEAVERQKRARERAPWEKRLRDAEERVEVLEQEQARLLESLGDPAGATDYAAVNRRLHDLQQELAAATSAWEEAALVLEEMGSL